MRAHPEMVADETHAPNMVAPLFTVFLFLFSSIFCFFFATIWVVKLGNCSLELGATRHFSETWRQSDECAYGPPTITEFYRVFRQRSQILSSSPIALKKFVADGRSFVSLVRGRGFLCRRL